MFVLAKQYVARKSGHAKLTRVLPPHSASGAWLCSPRFSNPSSEKNPPFLEVSTATPATCSMSSSLSALLKRSDITDHEEVIKACNATLKQSRGDTQAAHVKAVALLKLDRFDDALRVFEEGGDALKKRGQLEYAYALYKAGDLEKARELARVVSSRGAQHLEAQAVRRFLNFHCSFHKTDAHPVL